MADDRRDRAGAWIAAGVATLLAAACALPVLRHPRAHLCGEGGDAYGTLAGIVAVSDWIVGGPRPWLRGTDFQPLVDVPAGLLALALGPVAAYNLILLAGFPLAAWFGFHVADALGAGRRGALLAAQLFAFSPYHLAHAREHLDQAQVWPAALVAWAAIALLRQPRAASAAALVAAAAVAAAVNGYLPFLLLPLGVLFVMVALIFAPARGRLGVLAVVLALGGLGFAASRHLSVVRAELRTRIVRAAADGDVVRYSARLGEYLRLPPWHPLQPWLPASPAASLHGSTVIEQTLDVGVAPLLLALAGVTLALRAGPRSRRVALTFTAVACLSLWLSLPPWWGASSWFHEWFPWVRAPARFALVVQLVVSLYAGVAASRLRRLPFAVAACACLVAYLPARSWHEVEPIEVSAWLEANARSVADFPADANRYLRRFRPLVGVTALSVAEIALADISALGVPTTPERLAGIGASHVVAHGEVGEVATGLEEVLRLGQTRIFRVAAPVPPIAVSFRQGFAAPAGDGRWLLGEWGMLRLEPAVGTRQAEVRLRFVVHTPVARELVVEGDGVELLRVALVPGPGRALDFASPVSALGTTLVWRAVPAGARTAAGDRSGDPRPLALHVSELTCDPRVLIADDGSSLRLGDGIGPREPGDQRWIAGRGELEVSVASPRAMQFMARALVGTEVLSLTVGEERRAIEVSDQAWRAIELAIPSGTTRVVIDGGPARSIRAATGLADDRRVSVAIAGLEVRAPERAKSPL